MPKRVKEESMWKFAVALVVWGAVALLAVSIASARPMPGPKTYKAPHASYLDARK